MTNEQAIKLLKNLRKSAVMRDGDVVAIDMAIKALEQDPVIYPQVEGITPMVIRSNYPQVEGSVPEYKFPEPCEDAISRMMDAAIDEWRGEMENAIKRALEKQIEVLDKIRAELHATAEMHADGDYYLHEGWIDEIFDKYRAESEDKNE